MSSCIIISVDYHKQGGARQPHQVRHKALALVDDEPAAHS